MDKSKLEINILLHLQNRLLFKFSFKNLNSGVLKFLHMESKSKDPLISDSTLSSFEMELKRILIEIFDPEVNFIEKAV